MSVLITPLRLDRWTLDGPVQRFTRLGRKESQVEELLLCWEDDKSISADELCRDYPEHLTQVRSRIRLRKRMAWLSTSNGKPEITDEAQSNFKPGDQTIPGYHLIRRLGSGGFGEVWEARPSTGINIAIKFVSMTPGKGQREFSALQQTALSEKSQRFDKC